MGDRGYKTPTHTIVNAGTASGTALAANANRVYAHFQNDSGTVIYLGLGGAAATLNKGVRLPVNGDQAYEMSVGAGNIYTGVVHCIASTGGTVTVPLLVTEGI